MDVKKIPKGPFYIFRHCDIVQKSRFKKFFRDFFPVPKGLPFIFFHILQPAGVSQSPKGPPFTILSLRYSADFGRFRLVLFALFGFMEVTARYSISLYLLVSTEFRNCFFLWIWSNSLMRTAALWQNLHLGCWTFTFTFSRWTCLHEVRGKVAEDSFSFLFRAFSMMTPWFFP